MTDDFSATLPRDIERIASTVPAMPSEYGYLRSLLASIPSPLSPEIRQARATPTAVDLSSFSAAAQLGDRLAGAGVGDQSGASVGRYPEVFYGQGNGLVDPTFETIPVLTGPVAAGPGWSAIGPHWEGRFTLNSGVAPTVDWASWTARENGVRGFSSAVSRLSVAPSGVNAYNVKVELQNTAPFSPDDTDFTTLIGAIRAYRTAADPNGTGTITLQLVNSATGAVLASSSPLDYGATDQVTRLSARLFDSAAALVAVDYYLRIVFDLVHTAGGGASISFYLAEPQIGFSSNELPPPYTPLVAKWIPNRLRDRTADFYALDTGGGSFAGWWRLEGIGSAEAVLQFRREVEAPNVRMELGYIGGAGWSGIRMGGGAGATDVTLYRSAADTLKTDDDFIVGGTLDIVGAAIALNEILISEPAAARLMVSATGATEPRVGLQLSAAHAAASSGFFVWNSGDANVRASLGKDAAGNPGVFLGPGGAGAVDTNLYRSAASLLKTDDEFEIGIGGGKDTLRLTSTAADTGITFGGDTNLYRSAASVLTSDDTLESTVAGIAFRATAGAFQSTRANATDSAYLAYVSGDTQPRGVFRNDGAILLGAGGASAVDVVLSRTAANVLSLASGDVYAVNGTQVVTSRRTGWTAPTGIAQRGTFATDTVTLINLARAVKALIDDLTTHGLIGA